MTEQTTTERTMTKHTMAERIMTATGVLTITRAPGNIHYRFDAATPAVGRVASGEVVRFETIDAAAGQLRPGRSPEPFDRNRVNPVTGPLFVEGAEPGDLLGVRILNIDLAPEAHVWVRPGLGFATGEVRAPAVHRVSVDAGRGEAVFEGLRGVGPEGERPQGHRPHGGRPRGEGPRFSIPLHPHVGTIGVAPASRPLESKWPGPHGGNMDATAAGPGSTVWLPVFQPGALLSLGDVHGAMGDGEVGGTGVEAEATVTVEVTVVPRGPQQDTPQGSQQGQPQGRLQGPVIERPDAFLLFASADTVVAAAESAVQRALRLFQGLHGLSLEEAFMLISMAGDLRFCQVALPRAGVGLRLPRRVVQAPVERWPVGV